MRFPQPINHGTVVPLQHAGAPAAAENLRAAMKQSVLMTDLLHTQLQLRLVAFLLGGSMLFTMLDPVLLLLVQASDTILYRVAMSSTLRPTGVAALFGALALMLTPYIALQCGFLREQRREIVKGTCLALAGSALLWMFLAWRCSHLDLGASVAWVFFRNGVGSMLFALVLSFSLNAERVRSLLEDTR